MKTILTFLIFVLTILCKVNAQTIKDNDYLLEISDSTSDSYGYINLTGDIVIPFGKYSIIYTDTFRTFAIVLKPTFGCIGIDRNEKSLFKIFPFDNGPDYISDSLFRIIDKEKIGYANLSGEIVIKPQFDCAYPFENGKAQVSKNCFVTYQGEYRQWKSDNWFYIDKKGNRIIEEK